LTELAGWAGAELADEVAPAAAGAAEPVAAPGLDG
jgi:hypothetical protein